MIYVTRFFYTEESIVDFYNGFEKMIDAGEILIQTTKSSYSETLNVKIASHEGRTISVKTEQKYYFDDYRPYEHTDAIVFEFDDSGNRIYRTIPCTKESVADATDEEIALYEAYLEYNTRKKIVLGRLEDRRTRFIKAARKTGYDNYHVLRRLYDGVGEEKFPAAVKLVEGYKNNKLRSEFRKSIAKQIVNWLEDKDNKYRRPLSHRQMDYI